MRVLRRSSGEFLLAAFMLAILFVGTISAQQETQLGANAQIEGVVHDASGAPIPGAFLHLEAADHTSSHGATTDGVGHFMIPGLHSGKYSIRVKKLGFDSLDDSIELVAAQKKHCEFVLVVPAPSDFAGLIQLDDRPSFAVSGLSDSTGSGGHGSETRMRTSEGLAKETVGLGSGSKVALSGDPRQAREQVLQQLAANKDLPKPDEADWRRVLGDLDERLEDPLAAEHEYERAVALDPSEANYFSWGGELLLHRAAAQAIEVFSKGAQLYPRSVRMLAGLGAALYASGAVDDGTNKLCQAADLDPSSVAPYLFLGRIQEAVSTPLPCAEDKLARFAHDRPEDAFANYYDALAFARRSRGTADVGLQKREQALLEKAVALDPRLDAAYVELGNLQVEQSRVAQAVASYQKAIAANPANSQAHYRLGLAYKRTGDAEKAQAEFDLYKQLQQSEAASVERQRREVKQFLFTLHDESAAPVSSSAPK